MSRSTLDRIVPGGDKREWHRPHDLGLPPSAGDQEHGVGTGGTVRLSSGLCGTCRVSPSTAGGLPRGSLRRGVQGNPVKESRLLKG